MISENALCSKTNLYQFIRKESFDHKEHEQKGNCWTMQLNICWASLKTLLFLSNGEELKVRPNK